MAIEPKDLQNKVQNATLQPSSIVVGMGPAGIASAFFLLLLGHKVTLIDNRDECTRKQRVVLRENIIQQLFSLSSLSKMDYVLVFKAPLCFEIQRKAENGLVLTNEQHIFEYNFFAELASSNCAVSLKTFQNYQLANLLGALKNGKINFMGTDLEKIKQDILKKLDEINEQPRQEVLDKSRKEFVNELKLFQEKAQTIIDTPSKIMTQATKSLLKRFIEKQTASFILLFETSALSTSLASDSQKVLEEFQSKSAQLNLEIQELNATILKDDSLDVSLYHDLTVHCVFSSQDIMFKAVKMVQAIQYIQSSDLMKKMALVDKAVAATPTKESMMEMRGVLTIMRGSQYEVIEIDGNNQVLRLREKPLDQSLAKSRGKLVDKSQEKSQGNSQEKAPDKSQDTVHVLNFDYFVSAEGSKHEMVDLLIKSNPKAFAVNYQQLQQPRQQFHAVIVLKLDNVTDFNQFDSRVVGILFPGSSRMKETDLKCFKELGWNKNYLPLAFLDFNKKTKEFYCVCEIPESFEAFEAFEAFEGLIDQDSKKKNEQLQRWGELISKIEFGFDKHHISGLEFASVFQIQPKCADKNCIQLGKNGIFFIVGDALLSANVLFGHGVYNAIVDSQALFRCFKTDGSLADLNPMKERLVETLKDYQLCSDTFNDLLKRQETNHGKNAPLVTLYDHSSELSPDLSKLAGIKAKEAEAEADKDPSVTNATHDLNV